MQNLGLKEEHWKILSLTPMKNIFYEENFLWKEKEKDFNYFNWMSFSFKKHAFKKHKAQNAKKIKKH